MALTLPVLRMAGRLHMVPLPVHGIFDHGIHEPVVPVLQLGTAYDADNSVMITYYPQRTVHNLVDSGSTCDAHTLMQLYANARGTLVDRCESGTHSNNPIWLEIITKCDSFVTGLASGRVNGAGVVVL